MGMLMPCTAARMMSLALLFCLLCVKVTVTDTQLTFFPLLCKERQFSPYYRKVCCVRTCSRPLVNLDNSVLTTARFAVYARARDLLSIWIIQSLLLQGLLCTHVLATSCQSG